MNKTSILIGLFLLLSNTTAGAVNLLEELKSAIESSQQHEQRQLSKPTENNINFPNTIETYASTTEVPVEIKGIKLGMPIIEIVKNFPTCEFRSVTPDEKKNTPADQVGICTSKILNCYFNKNENCDAATFGGGNIKQITMIFKNKKLILVNIDIFGRDNDQILDSLKQKFGVKNDIIENDSEKNDLLNLGFTEIEINRMRRMTRDQLKEFQAATVMVWMNSKSQDLLTFNKRTGSASMANHSFIDEVETIEKKKKETTELTQPKKQNQQKSSDI